MAVLPRQKSVSEAATAQSLRSGGMSQHTKLSIALGIVAAVVVISGVLLWFCYRRLKRQRTEKNTAEEEVVDGFKVLRVKKFIPDNNSEAGSWRVIFNETESRSSSSVTTTHDKYAEGQDYALALSRFSDKEVVPIVTFASTTSAGPVHEPSSQKLDTKRTSLASRIKKICKISSSAPSSDIESGHIGAPQTCSSFAKPVWSSSTVKGDDYTSRKKERDVSEEILGIDKPSMLQRLTDPHAYGSSHLHVAPANLEQPCAFVNPIDVEFNPNPVMFSHLYAPSRAVRPMTSIAEADAASQLLAEPDAASQFSAEPDAACQFSAAEAVRRRVEVQLKEQPFEMDAVDSEFNPWHHAPMPIVGQVPHRWEKTLGSSRMFFDVEPGMVSGRKRRSLGDCSHSPEPPSSKRKLGFLMGRSQKRTAGLMQSAHTQVLPCANFSNVHQDQGIGSFEVMDALQQIHEPTYPESMTVIPAVFTRTTTPMPLPVMHPAVSPSSVQLNHLRQWQPNAGKYPEGPPTDWHTVDTSFAKNIALSHDQQVRFFVKFCNLLPTPTDDVVPREGLTFNGGPSAPSSPVSTSASLNNSSPTRPSIRSSGSSLVPVASRSSFESSASLTSQENHSTTSVVSLSSATTVSMKELPYTCTDCDLRFRTPGQRRTHHNRKHNLRYACVLCAAAFGLRKDLERHEFTVHRDRFRSEIRLFCPNMYCSTPQKEYNRKDNFNRHVKRCQQAIAKQGIPR